MGCLWKCDVDHRDGYDAPNLYQTITLPYFSTWRGFNIPFLSQFFFLKSQKINELNEFHSVRKGTFFQNPDFIALKLIVGTNYFRHKLVKDVSRRQ